MIDVHDFGPPRDEMMPDMFGLYEGYEIDNYLLARSSLLFQVNDRLRVEKPPTAGSQEYGEMRELTRQRHRALDPRRDWKLNELEEPDELMLRLWEIEEVWKEFYLDPRLAPLDPDLYGDWLAHCLESGQDVRLSRSNPNHSFGSIALVDLKLPPLYANPQHLLAPPTVSVKAPDGLGASVLMSWSAEEPVLSDGRLSVAVLPVTGDVARRLMIELGSTDERIAEIALKGVA